MQWKISFTDKHPERIGSKFFNRAFPSSSETSIPNYLRANLKATGSTMPFYSIPFNATLKALRP